jgi:DNA-binding response OmpR family regulator
MEVSNEMLLVDKSVKTSPEHEKALEHVGIAVLRVYTMQEAIARLANGEHYCCVVINEDTVPDFLGLLPELCGVSLINIYVTTHSFTKEKQSQAMGAGADAYVKFGETAMVDAVCLIQHLKLQEKWVKRPLKTLPVLIGGDITMLTDGHKVFCKDSEISLARKEYAMLYYFLTNPNRVLSFGQIANAVWDAENVAENAVYQQVNKVKSKLCAAGFNSAALVNITGYGYRLSTNLR